MDDEGEPDLEHDIEIPFLVLATDHGIRADLFLSRKLKRMSRSLAAEVIRQGNLRRQGGELIIKPASRVLSGELLLLRRKKLAEAPADDISVPVIYEDEVLLAVNKPGDLVVHPTASAYHRTLIRVLRTRRPELYLSLAHRIDKETSGLVLLAKTVEAETFLKAQFADRGVKKSYLAIVVGVPKSDRLRLDAPMRLRPESQTGVLMEIGGAGAQPAETEVQLIATGKNAALVEARPRTGRQHQIRLHLAHAGHPIIGDKLYLGDEEIFVRMLNDEPSRADVSGLLGHWRQALHAFSVTLDHPSSKTPIRLCAPLAADLEELLERHQIHAPPIKI